MAARKARTDAEKEHDKDKRLQRKFGITLANQNERRRQQANRCKLCNMIFDAEHPPCTDHYHFKIQTRRESGSDATNKWEAIGFDENGFPENHYARTKAAAIAAVKHSMMPTSIRGLLCRNCNRGLGYIERFFNAAQHPENLVPVMAYFQARIIKIT